MVGRKPIEKKPEVKEKPKDIRTKVEELAKKTKEFAQGKVPTAEKLIEEGFLVEQRTKTWTPGNQFHVDIALPQEKVIIEVDGPTHWSPIYGDVELLKVEQKDAKKDAVLIANGWKVLRVQDASGSTTRARFKRVLDALREVQYSKSAPKTYYVKP